MHRDLRPLEQLRALVARGSLLPWLLVLVVLLKAAVPLLAAASASGRDVSLAEICSVYGVRTVAIEERSDTSKPAQAEHAGSEHCALTSLLGAAAFASPSLAAVLLHAPPQRLVGLPTEPLARFDASLAWLASRTHAPPPLT